MLTDTVTAEELDTIARITKPRRPRKDPVSPKGNFFSHTDVLNYLKKHPKGTIQVSRLGKPALRSIEEELAAKPDSSKIVFNSKHTCVRLRILGR